MQTPADVRNHLFTKAAGDHEFRARLLADPKGTIARELDVTIPADFTIEVHEEDDTTAHLVLPPQDRLTRDDLAGVAGGWGKDPNDWCPWGSW